MAARHPLLEFIGSRYVHAQASSDELHMRALELIAAACVREWVDLPPQAKSVDVSSPQTWMGDSSPRDDDEADAASAPEDGSPGRSERPDPAPDGDRESWWGSSPDRADPDQVRGAWDQPPRP